MQCMSWSRTTVDGEVWMLAAVAMLRINGPVHSHRESILWIGLGQMNSVPSQWWQHLGGWMRLLCICTHGTMAKFLSPTHGWGEARCSPPSQIPKTPSYHMCQPLQVWQCWASCTFSFEFALHSFSQFWWGINLRSYYSQGGITLLWGMVWVRWAVTDTHTLCQPSLLSFLSYSKEKDRNSQNCKTKLVCAGSF